MWKRIASPLLASRITKVVRHFAQSIVDDLARQAETDVALAAGVSGKSLFLAYASRVLGDADYRGRALSSIDYVLSKAPSASLRMGLFSGAIGTVWVVDHVLSILGDLDEGETVVDESFDRALESAVEEERNCELLDGIAGIGVYALGRPGAESTAPILKKAVRQLYRLRFEDAKGVCWRSEPIQHDWARFPGCRLNLGMAHGTPGVIAFLAECIRAGRGGELERNLLERAVSWLLSVKNPPTACCDYRFYADDPTPGRAAWCYGDPGVYLALARAALATGRSDWQEEARMLAERILGRPMETMGITDASLCHGTAGLAHIYNAIYQATGDDRFRLRAVEMLEMTIRTCEDESGNPLDVAEPSVEQFGLLGRGRFGYLTGNAGAGLCLLSSMSSLPPRWDMPMLISLQ